MIRDELGRVRPKLRPADIRNAWMLYQQGYSTGWIAQRIYQRFGFQSVASCQAALLRAFRYRQTRTPKEAAIARRNSGRCCGCKCAYDEWTLGCPRCARRHNNPNRVGRTVAPYLRECSGCGCALDERTRGCKICGVRHLARRKRASRVKEAV